MIPNQPMQLSQDRSPEQSATAIGDLEPANRRDAWQAAATSLVVLFARLWDYASDTDTGLMVQQFGWTQVSRSRREMH